MQISQLVEWVPNKGAGMNIAKVSVLLFFAMAMLAINLTLASDKNLDRGKSMHSFVPEQGFVPDERTAMTIAEAILVPIYGKKAIERQKPFVVSLSGNVWTITGLLPKDILGGVFFVQISKQDARVITLTHGK